MELSHRFKGRSTPAIRATDHHVNNNEPHVILIRGNGAEWSLELDKLTTEYGKERDVDIQQLLESTDLIYIGKTHQCLFITYTKVRGLGLLGSRDDPSLIETYFYKFHKLKLL